MGKARKANAPEGMSKTKRAVLLLAALVGVPLLVLSCVLMPWIIPTLRHEMLRSKASRFLARPGGTDTSQGAYITGKVVLIDERAQALDELQKRLPDEIRAYSADEVGTVIWLNWDFKATENNWGGATGHYSVCKLTIIDRARNVIVAEREVVGANSPVATGAGRGLFRAPKGTMTARRNNLGVLGAIKNLPRR